MSGGGIREGDALKGMFLGGEYSRSRLGDVRARRRGLGLGGHCPFTVRRWVTEEPGLLTPAIAGGPQSTRPPAAIRACALCLCLPPALGHPGPGIHPETLQEVSNFPPTPQAQCVHSSPTFPRQSLLGEWESGRSELPEKDQGIQNTAQDSERHAQSPRPCAKPGLVSALIVPPSPCHQH